MAFLDKTGVERLWAHIISKLGEKAEINHTHNYCDAFNTSEYDDEGVWSVNIDGISELYDGLTIKIRITTDINWDFNTLNVNNLGDKLVWKKYGSRLTGNYEKYSELMLTYRINASDSPFTPSSGSLSGISCSDGWVIENCYDTNDYDRIICPKDTLTAGANNIYGRNILMQDANGTWQSMVLSYSSDTDKAKNPIGFRPELLRYYDSDSTVNSGSKTSEWSIHSTHNDGIDYRYFTNCGKTLTGNNLLYLVGTIDDNGLFYLDDTWWSESLPTFNDGKYYILIGKTYKSYKGTFFAEHPIYYHDGTSIREYIDIKMQKDISELKAKVAKLESILNASNYLVTSDG